MLKDACRSQVAAQQREAACKDVCVEELPRGRRLPHSIDGFDVGVRMREQHPRHIRALDPSHSAEPDMVGNVIPSDLPGKRAVRPSAAPGLRRQ